MRLSVGEEKKEKKFYVANCCWGEFWGPRKLSRCWKNTIWEVGFWCIEIETKKKKKIKKNLKKNWVGFHIVFCIVHKRIIIRIIIK